MSRSSYVDAAHWLVVETPSGLIWRWYPIPQLIERRRTRKEAWA